MREKKKIILSVVLIIALLLVPGVIFATNESTAETAIAQVVGGDTYTSLADAVAAAPKDNTQVTINLLKDVEDGPGIITVEGQNVVINFGGFSYDASTPTVGSDGTETLSCQLNKGSTVTFKNGTFTTTKAKMLVQNYGDLTIENMVLDATKSINNKDNKCYGVSTNCGTVKIIGDTNIASKGWPAIDVCWAPNTSYTAGTQVTVDTTGTVTGDIKLSLWEETDSPKNSLSTLTIKNIKHDGNIVFEKEDLSGNLTVKGGSYTDIANAILAVPNDNEEVTIKLLKNIENGSGIVTVAGQNVVIDFNGFSYDASNPTVGSDGTKTLSCQLNKGSTVTFKNGTFTTTKAKMLVQNYGDLTIENMVLDATKSVNTSENKCYGVSNNCGIVNIIGKTDITSKGWPAIDVCWAPNTSYTAGTQVTVDTTGTVTGDIKLSLWDKTDSPENSKSTLLIKNINHDGNVVFEKEELNKNLTIVGGIFNTDVNDYVAEGYFAKKQTDGKYFVKEIVDISNCEITGISNKVYTGKALKHNIVVKYQGIKLEEGNDYKVSYLNNTKPGEATIVVEGKELYKGKITKTFIITPKKLTGLKVSDKTTSKIKLSWSKHEGVTGYKVYSYNYSKKKWEYVGKTSNTSYTIDGLKSATTYKYRVRAYKNVNDVQHFGEYSSSVKTATKPKTPSVKVKAGDKKVTFTWNKVSGATGYKIYMATSKNGKYTRIKTITNNKTFKYTKSGLKANKKYYFKVRAYKQVDDKQIFSSYTKVLSVTTKKVHIVKKGDTLYSIAKKYKSTVVKLTKINKLKKANLLKLGLRLLVN